MLTNSSPVQTLKEKAIRNANRQLKDFLDKKTISAALINPQYETLWRTITQYALAGGKRLRPYMTLLAYDAFGGQQPDRMLPIATAQELLHLSMLVHDDIIDRDLTRHGMKNIQGTYAELYRPSLTNPAEVTHYANSAALMAGDLLLSGAYELCLSSGLPDASKLLAQQYLASAVFSVVGGELLDTEAPLHDISLADTRNICLLKTASYSFVTPLLTGAALADASQDDTDTLTAFGESLGIAYQLTDDLLGVFGDDTVTGKSTTSDLSEAKRTLLLQKTYERSTDVQRPVLDRLVGNASLSSAEAEQIRAIMVHTGAKASIESAIEHHVKTAQLQLDKLPISQAHKDDFDQLIVSATKRER